jgi:gliding motility-associated-like protein
MRTTKNPLSFIIQHSVLLLLCCTLHNYCSIAQTSFGGYTFAKAVVAEDVATIAPYGYTNEKYTFKEGDRVAAWIRTTDITKQLQTFFEWYNPSGKLIYTFPTSIYGPYGLGTEDIRSNYWIPTCENGTWTVKYNVKEISTGKIETITTKNFQLTCNAVVSPCRKNDSLELIKLYTATNGANWTNKWDLSKPMTTWYGIKLNASGCVECIDMDGSGNCLGIGDTKGNNLVGTLPNMTFSSLKTLGLTSNQLSGNIPNFNLPNLQGLSLRDNQFVGTIPAFNLPNLQSLYLDRNKLSGNIPNFNLPNLTSLYLGNNQLIGSIPNFNMPNLVLLNLSVNKLTGNLPISLGSLSKLTYLEIVANQISGSIPSEIGNLQSLQHLSLSGNRLTGKVPTSFKNLTSLKSLFLLENQLTDLPDITNLPLQPDSPTTGISGLNIQQNKFTFKDILPNIKFATTAVFRYTPQDTIYRDTTLSKKVGESIALNLGIDAAITTNKYEWYKNSTLQSAYTTSSNTLTIPSLQTTDAGTWRVKVTNPNAPLLTLWSKAIKIQVQQAVNVCRQSDSLSLIALYNSTNGANWTNKWDLSKPMTTWYGIKLNASGCVECIDLDGYPLDCYTDAYAIGVNGVNLTGNNLQGTLPLSLDNLTELKVLILSHSKLTDNLPNFKFAKLEILGLNHNNLTGSIPNFTIASLKRLLLNSNNLSGSIPNFVLPQIQQLSLSNNKLSGSLPLFDNVPNLEFMWISSNLLSGNIPNFSVVALKEIILANNQLSGNIPALNLPNLDIIQLDNNKLSGDIPIFNLPKLANLHISGNKVTFIPSMTNITTWNDKISRYGTISFNVLKLDNNSLSFTSVLNNITIIDKWATKSTYTPQDTIYRDTTLSKKVGESIALNLGIDAAITTNKYEWYKNSTLQSAYTTSSNTLTIPSLQTTDAGTWRVKVTNPTAPLLTLWSKAIKIQVQQVVNACRQSDSLSLIALYNSTNGANWTNKWDLSKPMTTWYGIKLNSDGCVECIDMDGTVDCVNSGGGLTNNLSGTLPNLSMDNLIVLVLSNNKLSGNVPNLNLPKLQQLELSNNQFTGVLPDFDKMPNLKRIQIISNNLTGNIPNFNYLPNLTQLYLYQNQLSGSIPNFEKLTNLTSIDLSNNQLSGSIPNFNLPKLLYLTITYNNLTGSIPSSIGSLSNLIGLYLVGNKLTGTIPPEIGNLQKLQNLTLTANLLSGKVPASFKNLTSLKSLFLLENQLTDLPDISNLPLQPNSATAGIQGLNASYNKFTFKDILSNIKFATTASFSYTPQDTIYRDTTLTKKVGESIALNLGIDAAIITNKYEWYKNSTLQSAYTTSSNTLTIPSLQTTDAGTWRVKVTNPTAPLLTLWSKAIKIQVQQVVNPCRQSDSLSLIALYNSTNGANWTNKWDLSKPMTTWYGIKLNASGCVEWIDMDGVKDGWSTSNPKGNNLTGTLPNLNLQNLTCLVLPLNQLSGAIPNFNLPNLEYLGLNNNQLSSIIPNFDLPKLTFLALYANKLTGVIPIFNTPNLQYLSLSINQLSGSIPNFNMPNLQSLGLSVNQLSGTIPDFNMLDLKELSLYSNQLNGAIPNFNMPNLQYLWLYSNQLSGVLPMFDKFLNLKKIYVQNNKLNGCFPTSISKLCILDFSADINIDGYNFTGNKQLPYQGDFSKFCVGQTQTGATCDDSDATTTNDIIQTDCSCKGTKIIVNTCRQTDSLELIKLYTSTNGANWTNKWDLSKPMTTWYGIQLNASGCVEWIDMDGVVDGEIANTPQGNNLTGVLPNLSLDQLRTLILPNNKLNGTIPNFNLPNLLHLSLSQNQLSGNIPNFNLPNLAYLDIYQNQLNGNIPNFNTPKLARLDLSNNQLSGNIPNFNTPKLALLNLSNNQLSGNIPLFNMPKLRQLFISFNKLSGLLPNFDMPEMTNIALYNNQLSGSIPNFNMPKLRTLYIATNQLTGIIPNFNMPELQLLLLNNNQLSGSIPNFNLPKLHTFQIQNNQLTGSIPNFNLPNLQYLVLEYNQLSGTIPNFNLPNLLYLAISGNQLTGNIPNLNTPKLNTLLFENNKISLLPNISALPLKKDSIVTGSTAIRGLRTQNNQLTFKDILPNIGFATTATFIYTPQDTIFRDTTLSKKVGESLALNLGIDAAITTNKYEWYKNSTLQSAYTTSSNTLTIPSLQTTDAGTWRVKVTNPTAPLLTLWSKAIKIQVQQVVNACRQSDSLSLIALYNSTNGANWTNKWDLSKPMNTWYGIKLTNCVESISLANNNLTGIVPNLNMSSLTYLQLSSNKLTGGIPNFDLPSLKIIDIENNQLTGNIPNFNLPSLINLDLSNNQLSGNIPNFNTPKIEYLALNGNKLSGTIPPFNYKDLIRLYLADNELTGNIPNLNLPNVAHVLLGNNKLSGSIPNFNLPNLTVLGLNYNQLTGNIPNFDLPRLQWLALNSNKLTGQINNFRNITNITVIRLDNNNLSGCFPIEFNKLCNIAGSTYNFTNNPQLPYQGDFSKFCTGQTQTGATCDDGNAASLNDVIQSDCSCKGTVPCQVKASLLPVSNSTCAGSKDAKVTAQAIGGIAPYTFTLTNTAAAPKQTNTTGGFSNLDKGTYQIAVSDTKNCRDSLKITVTEPAALRVSIVGDGILCTGNTNEWQADGKFPTYKWSSGEVTSKIIVKNTGTYTVSATDASGCTATASKSTQAIARPDAKDDAYETVNGRTIIAIPFEKNDVLDKNGSWDVTILNIPQKGTLRKDNSNKWEYETSDIFIGKVDFKYKVCNKTCPTAAGCDTAQVVINITRNPDYDATPDAFSPNGDRINDLFEFPEIRDTPEKYPLAELEVFNRWGALVYRSKPYKNDWDGTFQITNVPVPDGDYYYIMRFSLSDSKVKVGNILVIRGR